MLIHKQKYSLFRFVMTGRLSGGHQAAVMCMAVGKVSNEEDLVITGSKDHYIKVIVRHGQNVFVLNFTICLKRVIRL